MMFIYKAGYLKREGAIGYFTPGRTADKRRFLERVDDARLLNGDDFPVAPLSAWPREALSPC